MSKIQFNADLEIEDLDGTHLPHLIPLKTPVVKDEYWFADNTISLNLDTVFHTVTIELLDPDAKPAGTSYEHDILDDYFVRMKAVGGSRPKIKFIEMKTRPELTNLSDAEFKNQMEYFNTTVKPKIERYFDQLIDEITEYIESKGYTISSWE